MLKGTDWTGLKIDHLPKLCEWTRIDISHEEEDGEYFIILSVGGKEVGRTQVDDSDFENLEDVKIHTGGMFEDEYDFESVEEAIQTGIIRGLVILEKR